MKSWLSCLRVLAVFAVHGGRLYHLCNGVVYACVQVDLRSTWTVVSSVILAFAFAFQNSVRHLFESVIFLFFIHPCAPHAFF